MATAAGILPLAGYYQRALTTAHMCLPENSASTVLCCYLDTHCCYINTVLHHQLTLPLHQNTLLLPEHTLLLT